MLYQAGKTQLDSIQYSPIIPPIIPLFEGFGGRPKKSCPILSKYYNTNANISSIQDRHLKKSHVLIYLNEYQKVLRMSGVAKKEITSVEPSDKWFEMLGIQDG